MAQLKDLIVSRVRVKLIKLFLQDPQEMYYVRQLTRKTDEEINAVRRELNHLEDVGFLKSEPRGNRLYYFPSTQYDFYPELLLLVAKTTGLGAAVRKHRNKIGKIKFALMSGAYIRRLERSQDQVDLLVVGTVVLPELTKIVQQFEQKRQETINYTAMTVEEFHFRKSRRDPFLLGILNQARVMLIGDEIDLLASTKESTNSA